MQSNDFREAVFKVVNQLVNPVNLREADKVSEATTSILAICKEMLVFGESKTITGWNFYREQLLKQLGEK